MLYEDVRSQLIPYRLTDSQNYLAELRPDPGVDVRELISQGLTPDERWGGLDQGVESWLREAGSTLVICGRVAYEIVFLRSTQTGETAGFELHLVSPGAYFRRWGRDYQYVPGREGKRRGRSIRLDSDRLIVAEFPRKRRRQLMRALRAVDVANEFLPASTQLGISAMYGRLAYDFAQHRKTSDVALARSTRSFGWDARGLFADRQLEPYRVWRELQFEAFKIEVREILIRAVNSGLVSVGQRLGWSTSIELCGLPGREDVTSAEASLRDGARGVDEILRQFHPWLKASDDQATSGT